MNFFEGYLFPMLFWCMVGYLSWAIGVMIYDTIKDSVIALYELILKRRGG